MVFKEDEPGDANCPHLFSQVGRFKQLRSLPKLRTQEIASGWLVAVN